jgi:hypothetical protein
MRQDRLLQKLALKQMGQTWGVGAGSYSRFLMARHQAQQVFAEQKKRQRQSVNAMFPTGQEQGCHRDDDDHSCHKRHFFLIAGKYAQSNITHIAANGS